jgi:hypothetical protein
MLGESSALPLYKWFMPMKKPYHYETEKGILKTSLRTAGADILSHFQVLTSTIVVSRDTISCEKYFRTRVLVGDTMSVIVVMYLTVPTGQELRFAPTLFPVVFCPPRIRALSL